MTSLTNRPNAWEGTVPLHEAINSLFEQSFLSPAWRPFLNPSGGPGIPLDVYEDGDNYYILAVLPGVDPSKLEIVSQDTTLTISGEIPNFLPQGKQMVWHECRQGRSIAR